jgi:hypothetical protein
LRLHKLQTNSDFRSQAAEEVVRVRGALLAEKMSGKNLEQWMNIKF